MRRVKPVPRPGPCGGWSHSESGGLCFARSVIYSLPSCSSPPIIYFFFHFQYSSYFSILLFPLSIFFLSSPICPFLHLPTYDLMLHCGLSVSLLLCLPPSFPFLLSPLPFLFQVFGPGYFTASQGCSLFFFHFTSCVKHDIFPIYRVFDPGLF